MKVVVIGSRQEAVNLKEHLLWSREEEADQGRYVDLKNTILLCCFNKCSFIQNLQPCLLKAMSFA